METANIAGQTTISDLRRPTTIDFRGDNDEPVPPGPAATPEPAEEAAKASAVGRGKPPFFRRSSTLAGIGVGGIVFAAAAIGLVRFEGHAPAPRVTARVSAAAVGPSRQSAAPAGETAAAANAAPGRGAQPPGANATMAQSADRTPDRAAEPFAERPSQPGHADGADQPPASEPGQRPLWSPLTPSEIVTQDRKIVASSMMPAEQVSVLDLVTATNALVLQVRSSVADQGKQIADVRAQMAELQQRISLREASASLAAAKGPTPQVQEPAQAPEPAPKTVAASSRPNCLARPRYTIASVSPRFVTLRGGSEPLIDLSPGSTIPCYGRIKEIRQENARWVVKTDHDMIGVD